MGLAVARRVIGDGGTAIVVGRDPTRRAHARNTLGTDRVPPGHHRGRPGLRSAAIAPIRVNAISPGWTDTPIWDTLPALAASKQERFATMARRLPVGRIGRADDIADAAVFLMQNGYTTGTILDVDGGHQLV